jgi:hypothetical protein
VFVFLPHGSSRGFGLFSDLAFNSAILPVPPSFFPLLSHFVCRLNCLLLLCRGATVRHKLRERYVQSKVQKQNPWPEAEVPTKTARSQCQCQCQCLTSPKKCVTKSITAPPLDSLHPSIFPIFTLSPYTLSPQSTRALASWKIPNSDPIGDCGFDFDCSNFDRRCRFEARFDTYTRTPSPRRVVPPHVVLLEFAYPDLKAEPSFSFPRPGSRPPVSCHVGRARRRVA